ncbi:hypothetical protein EVAR_81843_1 [Eumeta japonica]|uniref:Uncharacterized protein n=1 Tax=Eumeta variegata TaxID=151549 RepID=A0A4C1XQH2_EUMVA|nr:hypothetical protein EVAR_81843_1 [Eumeta japonica]
MLFHTLAYLTVHTPMIASVQRLRVTASDKKLPGSNPIIGELTDKFFDLSRINPADCSTSSLRSRPLPGRRGRLKSGAPSFRNEKIVKGCASAVA